MASGVPISPPCCAQSLPPGTVIRPWGWNAALCWRLTRWGTHPDLIPGTEQIGHWRQLSHRRITIAIHHRLRQLTGIEHCPIPTEITTLDSAVAFAERHPGCYLKAPWSGSGRGILRALDPHRTDFLQRAAGMLRDQGSVLCEPALDRVLDFAVEMHSNGGSTVITGYSVFESDFHSQYACGIVAPRDDLRQKIETLLPAFPVVESALAATMNELVAPFYTGPLGVDMLLYRGEDGDIGINPCVELNLRCTMGHVTAALADRHGLRGRYSIKAVGALTPDDRTLTPIGDATRFAAILTAT